MDIYNFSGFKWWCKNNKKSNLLALGFLVFFIAIFSFMFISSWKTNISAKSNVDSGVVVMLIIMFFVFIIMFFSILQKVINSFNVKVEQWWIGTIKEFYVKRTGTSGHHKTKYYIVAIVDGKELDIRCVYPIYHRAKQGESIIVFKIKGDKNLKCVYPEM